MGDVGAERHAFGSAQVRADCKNIQFQHSSSQRDIFMGRLKEKSVDLGLMNSFASPASEVLMNPYYRVSGIRGRALRFAIACTVLLVPGAILGQTSCALDQLDATAASLTGMRGMGLNLTGTGMGLGMGGTSGLGMGGTSGLGMGGMGGMGMCGTGLGGMGGLTTGMTSGMTTTSR
jgi:hypothetical protein